MPWCAGAKFERANLEQNQYPDILLSCLQGVDEGNWVRVSDELYLPKEFWPQSVCPAIHKYSPFKNSRESVEPVGL